MLSVKTKRELQFVTYVVLMAMIWMPIAVWLMPLAAGAPTWEENPMWYITSAIIGVVLAWPLRWAVNRITVPRRRLPNL